MSQDEIGVKSSAIFTLIASMPEYQSAKGVLVYASFDNEVETGALIEELKKREVKIYLPVIISDTEFVPGLITEETQKNRYGINEPMPIETAQKGSGKIDLAICPGVGFDRAGNRLGYGKGYYDRYLAGENIFKIGLAYELQLVEKLPSSKEDVLMDAVVTEKAVYRTCG